jgi:hypothetical protein
MNKVEFEDKLKQFVKTLQEHVSLENGDWSVKGFIDYYQNIYTISADTKIVSKILEIHLFPHILKFANDNGFKVVLATHQNYYPDISLVYAEDDTIRFAVDIKTTYRKPNMPNKCNGFTLGSHGEYFVNRSSSKNIQFPYKTYSAHYCLGIIYDRADSFTLDETRIYDLKDLQAITSVIGNFQFFVSEKWKLASDRSGSGNTANIGSIDYIPDILTGNGPFSNLGEEWFDEYWMNYKKIIVPDSDGTKKISNLVDFVRYKKGDLSLIVKRKKVKK